MNEADLKALAVDMTALTAALTQYGTSIAEGDAQGEAAAGAVAAAAAFQMAVDVGADFSDAAGLGDLVTGMLALQVDLKTFGEDFSEHPDKLNGDAALLVSDDAAIIAGLATFLVPEYVLAITAIAVGLNFIGQYLKEHPEGVRLPFLLGKPGFSDPLVLDLGSLGIQTTSLNGSPTYFDYAGNGAKVRTGWIKSGEGILVTAPVDGATVRSFDVIGAQSGSGFQDLADFDGNGDGVLDKNDPAFGTLRVWIDSDQNGSSTAGELFTLDQLGITSINLRSDGYFQDSNGNTVVGAASFQRSDGSISSIYEVNFQTDPQNTVLPTTGEQSTSAAQKLPNLDGFGLLPDLQIAMSSDATLLQMVTDIVSESGTLTGQQFDAAFKDILYRWAGVQNYPENGDGPYVDVRQAGFIDAYFGENPNDVLSSGTQPNFHNGPTVWTKTFQQLLESFKSRFASQIPFSLLEQGTSLTDVLTSPYAAASFLNFDSGTNQFTGHFEDIFKAAQNLAPQDAAAASAYWDKVVPVLQALRWDVTNTQDPIAGSGLAQLAVDAGLADYAPKIIAELMNVPNPVSLGDGTYGFGQALSVASSNDGSTNFSTGESSDDSTQVPYVFSKLNGSLYEPYLIYTAYIGVDHKIHFNIGAGLNDLKSAGITLASGSLASSDTGLSLFLPVAGSYNSVGVSSSGDVYVAPTGIDDGSAKPLFSAEGIPIFATPGEAGSKPFAYGVYTFQLGSGTNYIFSGTVGDIILPKTSDLSNLRFEGFNNTKALKLFFVDDAGNPTGDSVDIEDALGSSGRTIDKILLNDGTNIFPGGNFTSTWFGSSALPAMVGYNGGANIFEAGIGTKTINLGKAGGDRVDYSTNSGQITIDLDGSGTTSLRFDAGVIPSSVVFESFTDSGDLKVIVTDANGNPTGDSILLHGALTEGEYPFVQSDALKNIRFADGTTRTDLLDLTSTWFGTAGNTSLVGSDWGANTFALGTGGDAVVWGNGSRLGSTDSDSRPGNAGRIYSSNYNLVKYALGDGAVAIDPNGGVGDIQFGAGITADDIVFESDNATGDLKLLITDANGNPTGDSILLRGALTEGQYPFVQYDVLKNIRFADGTIRTDLLDLTSTWFGTAGNTSLVGSDWGANTFALGTGGDAVVWGNGSRLGSTDSDSRPGNAGRIYSSNYNLVKYALGDGAVTIDPNGGVGDIQFGAGITADDIVFESDNATGDLKLLITDANGNPTGDSILLRGALTEGQYPFVQYDVLKNIRFADGSTISDTTSLTNTWFGTAGNTNLTGSGWGANAFVLGAGNDIVIWGGGNHLSGVDRVNASNDNLVKYFIGDGAVTINTNRGIGDIQFGAGITADNIVFEIDNATGGVKLLITGADGAPTGDTILLVGALTEGSYPSLQYDALKNIRFADGTALSNLTNLSSTWFGSTNNSTLIGSNWGPNTFVLGAGVDVVTWGNGKRINASNRNLVKYSLGDGAVTINVNGGVGDIALGAGISASNVIFQSDAATGDVTILITDADGNPTGDSILLPGAVSNVGYYTQGDALQSIRFADGTSISDMTTFTNTWLGSAGNTNLVGSSWGQNTFVTGLGGDTITWGHGNGDYNLSNTNHNLVKYSLGDGAVTINVNGGVGDIAFGAGISASNVIFQSDAATGDVTILITDADGNPTGDSILLRSAMANWGYYNQGDALQNIHFADGTSITDMTTFTNTWLGSASNTNLVGSSLGQNTFVTGPGGDTITWGHGNGDYNVSNTNHNLVKYSLGDGAVTINVNGGVGDIDFGAGISESNVVFANDDATGYLKLVITGANGMPTGDSIVLSGEVGYQAQNSALKNLRFVDQAPNDLVRLAPEQEPITSEFGSATSISSDTYQLTPDQPSQGGSVWGTVDLSKDVIWTTSMFFGSNDAGADGLAFGLTNAVVTSPGSGGSSLGVLTGNSFGIKFDTYSNGDLGDPNSDFSQFILNGDTTSASANFDAYHTMGNIEDGAWHDVVISWDAAAHSLSYSFDGKIIASKSYNIVDNVLDGSAEASFGFGAGTGGASNDQRLRLFSVTSSSDVLSVDTGATGDTLVGQLLGVDPNTGDLLNYKIVDAGGDVIDDPYFEIGSVDKIRVKAGVTIGTSIGLNHTLKIKTTDQDGESFTSNVEIDIRVPGEEITASGDGEDMIGTEYSDVFAFNKGFGSSTIENFSATGSSHDILRFDRSVFTDWAHLIGATHQASTDLKIDIDPQSSIILKDVSLSSFTSADVRFI
jgi:hypothetical protein